MTEAAKARQRRYDQRPENKASKRLYKQRYNQRDYVKLTQRLRYSVLTDEERQKRAIRSTTNIKWKIWAFKVLKANLGGCVDCGYNLHPEVLDFDHHPGTEKRAAVGTLKCRTWAIILDEIAKCDLLCANCHRLRTLTRRKT